MAWAHSQQLAVLQNGGLYAYPVLASSALDPVILGLANSLKGTGAGGACATNFDLAFYGDAALTDLLQFEAETIPPGAAPQHDLTDGTIRYWVGVPETQGVYWMAWGDASVVSSLASHTTLWSDYLVSPVTIPGPTVSATGFVIHCNDNAATDIVVNSVVGSANTCAFRLGDLTDAVSVVAPYGGGLTFTGSTPGNNGLAVAPDVLDFFGTPPPPTRNDNKHITMEISFMVTSGIGSGNLGLTNNVYFAEVGYFFGISPAGHLVLAESGVTPPFAVTGSTVLVHDTWYHATAIIDDLVASIYLGTTLDGTGAINHQYAAPGNRVYTGFYPNSGYWEGVIDEWRMVLAVRPVPVIPTGSITVRKTTSPVILSRAFDFTATPLTPSTFSLHHGEEQVFSGIMPGTYGIVEIPASGWDTSYSISNGGTNTAIVVGNGDDVIVTVTNSLPYQTIRRLRRAWLPNEEMIRVIADRFELELQAGLGTTGDIAGIEQYASPRVMVRVSKDAGKTWSQEREMTTGELGQYSARTFLTRLGQYRKGMIEISVSDPVSGWYLVQAYGTFRKGTS